VARNVSDKSQIVQHMPFREVVAGNGSNLLGTAQKVGMAQTTVISNIVAISTVATMAAIVLSTRYLSQKLMIFKKNCMIRISFTILTRFLPISVQWKQQGKL